MIPFSSLQGQCLCGKVVYRIKQAPKAVGNCYCKSCQIKSGSDHLVYLACETESVDVNGPVKWFESTGDSQLSKQHGFCSECGSTLFGKPQYWPHLLIVYAGSLSEGLSYAPQVNLWLQDAPQWSCIDKSLAGFEGNPS